MKFSVIIPTRRRCRALARTLDSLATQIGGDFEAIVICDGEDEETRSLSQSRHFDIPVTWTFVPESRGLAAARNLGAAESHGDWLLFLDDDATVEADWVARHLKYHLQAPCGAPILVMGRVVHRYDRPPLSPTERRLREQRWQPDERYAAAVRNLDVDSGQNLEGYCGFNCSLRKDVFLESGGFDTAMSPVDEEMELGHRLHRKGLETIVALDATAYHHDTKDLVAHHEFCQENSGNRDVYRISIKGQRSRNLTALGIGRRTSTTQQLRTQVAWDHPNMMMAIAGFWRAIADLTDSAWCFRRWLEFAMPAGYWKGVRSAGISLEKLEGLAGAPLPVLALHGIMPQLDAHERLYHLSPGQFQRLLEALARLGYRSTSFLGNHIAEGRRYQLTFDDAYENLHSELLPLMKRYELRPLVFLVADHLGGMNSWDFPLGVRPQRILSVHQVREMHGLGVEFGSHTCTHPLLTSLSGRDLEREVAESKRKLEDLLGAEVTSFAYPYGAANSAVRAAVARAGYRLAFSTCPGLSWWDDPFWIRRLEVRDADPWIASLAMVITGVPVWRKLGKTLRHALQTGNGRLPQPVVEALRRVKRELDIPL